MFVPSGVCFVSEKGCFSVEKRPFLSVLSRLLGCLMRPFFGFFFYLSISGAILQLVSGRVFPASLFAAAFLRPETGDSRTLVDAKCQNVNIRFR